MQEASPINDKAGHTIQDVLPWLLWGNAPDDSTTIKMRVKALIARTPDTLNGIVDAVDSYINEYIWGE